MSSNPILLYMSMQLFERARRLDGRDRWLIRHVLDCFSEVDSFDHFG
jgi:hypothetical protein